MKIERFEDIKAWREARKLVNMVYNATDGKGFNKDYGLSNQIQRASVSIMANIAEGFDRKSKKEFINFLKYACSSSSEVKSHLYVALDREYINKENFREIYNRASLVSSLINGFMKYLRSGRGEAKEVAE